jgi:cytochrome P450
MDAQKDDGTLQRIRDVLQSGSWIGQVPWLYWIHDRIMPIVGNFLAVNVRHSRIRDFAVQEIQSRNDRGSDHKDILSKLFDVQREKPEEFREADVTSMAASNIMAGSDTTAISVRAVIYHLLRNPEYKRLLLEEIDKQRKENKIADIVTLEQSKRMPYLQAVVQEALRCHPAIGMSLPRVTPSGGIEICGNFIPQGVSIIFRAITLICICSYADILRPSSERIPGLYIGTPKFTGLTQQILGLIDGSRKTLAT